MNITLLALGKLGFAFAAMLFGLRLRLGLWLCVLMGSLCVALTSGMPITEYLGLFPTALLSKDFMVLTVLVCLILTLSGIQEATGQSLRLVAALEKLLHSPRLRLIFFPALIGLLPMPGGALFSCPMLDGAARRMDLASDHKAAINYWFRHIWEVAWPLYPGYILTCSLLDLPLSSLFHYTFPLVLISLLVGFLLLRKLPPEKGDALPRLNGAERRAALSAALYESLPITVALVGALPAAMLADLFLPGLPKGSSFLGSLGLACITALLQGGRAGSLAGIIFCRNTGRMFLLLSILFVFKLSLEHSGLISSLSGFGSERWALYLFFIFLPFICGLLTGLMLGYVGTSFPILIGVAAHAGLSFQEAMPLYVLALAAGNCGQMLSPLHVCLVVSCEYFKVGLGPIVRYVALPTLVQFCGSLIWFFILFYFLPGGI